MDGSRAEENGTGHGHENGQRVAKLEEEAMRRGARNGGLMILVRTCFNFPVSFSLTLRVFHHGCQLAVQDELDEVATFERDMQQTLSH
jgi:hypothetical protein